VTPWLFEPEDAEEAGNIRAAVERTGKGEYRPRTCSDCAEL
jgi:hypothetical protein